MSEFDLIASLQRIICLPADIVEAGCRVGIGDDSAVLEVPPGHELIVCTDTLVEGVHFPSGTRPEAIGHKALAVNLSDLAAMGARPTFFFLALTLPTAGPAWLEAFSRGMASLARQSRIQLAGGDTTSGPLSVTITAMGVVDKGRALLRSGARPGDKIVVSGIPGAAARALQLIKNEEAPDPPDRAALEFPVPRLGLGQALLGKATACIDLSDGLAADLGHVLHQSGAGALIELDRLPRSNSLEALPDEARWPLQLAGGDDYELCFTVSPSVVPDLPAIANSCGVELAVVGTVVRQPGLKFARADGSLFGLASSGYEHFSGQENST